MKTLLIVALAASIAFAAPTPGIHVAHIPAQRAAGDGPFSFAVNIAEDLQGTEQVPGTWGLSQAYTSAIQFDDVPAGYQVRVLRVYGDFIAFPSQGALMPSGSCEIGWGLKTTASDGTGLASYPGYSATPFGNSMVWVQDSIGSDKPRTRIPFDFDTSAGGLIGTDNILLSQAFVALNTTGLAIHLEPTFVVVFRFEKTTGQ